MTNKKLSNTRNVGNNASVTIEIEVLNADSFSDLIKQRRPGHAYRPAKGTTRAISVSFKDMILLPLYAHESPGPVGQAIDRQIGGNLTESITAEEFDGTQGRSFVIDLEAAGLGSGNPRRIVAVGMGPRADCGQFSYCALAGTIISIAERHMNGNIIVPLQDLFDSKDERSVRQFVAVLTCRLEQHLNSKVEHGLLKRVRLLVDEGVKDAAVAALSSFGKPLCGVCSDPSF